jgi:hypothetical protein
MTWLPPSASAISIDNFNERFIACSPERSWRNSEFIYGVAAMATTAPNEVPL